MLTEFILERCNGCGQCELACAFKATETFWLPASAIRIVRSEAGRGDGYCVRLDSGSCDLCEPDEMPACQRVCKSGLLNRAVITQLRGQMDASLEKALRVTVEQAGAEIDR